MPHLIERPLPSLALLALGAAALILPGLSTMDVRERAEARIAQTALEMDASGEVLIPTLAGEPRLEKPPVSTWLPWIAFEISGGPSILALRLPFAVGGILTVLLVFGLVRDSLGPRVAWTASLLLLTSYAFLEHAREADLDGVLALGVVAAARAFQRGWCARPFSRPARVGFFAATALAILTKGPLALLFIVPIAVLLARSAGPDRAPIRRDLLWGLPLLAALAIPWYGYVLAETEAGDRFRSEILARIGLEGSSRAQAIGGIHARPAWYYLEKMPVLFAPWIALAPIAAWAALRREARPYAGWFLVPIAIFTCFSGKEARYLLPILPAYVVLVALGIDRLAESPPRLSTIARWTSRIAGWGWLAAAAALPFAGLLPIQENPFATASRLGLVAAAGVGAAIGILHLRRVRQGSPLSVPTLAAMVVLALVVDRVWVAAMNRDTRETALGRSIRALAGERDVYVYRTFAQPTTLFAIGRPVEQLDDPELAGAVADSKVLYLLTSEDRAQELPSPYRERCRVVLRASELPEVARDERRMVLLEYR